MRIRTLSSVSRTSSGGWQSPAAVALRWDAPAQLLEQLPDIVCEVPELGCEQDGRPTDH